MNILVALFLLLCLGLLGCERNPDSELHLSKEARYVLGSPRAIDSSLLDSVNFEQMGQDLRLQRRFAWELWRDLQSEKQGFAKWQTWYAKEDLQRIFRRAYERLGRRGRLERRPFSDEEISAALRWHDGGQFEEPAWNKERFDLWFAAFDSENKKRSIPGINKVLMNEKAIRFFLQHYSEIHLCSRQSLCSDLEFPQGAAFLKLAWRRGQDEFTIPSYRTDAEGMALQLSNSSWLESGRWIPREGESYRMESATGQIFHLAGLHSSLRFSGGWFWSSLWLSEEKDVGFGFDRPHDLNAPWDHYQLCSSQNFLKQELGGNLDEALVLQKSAWCSNPYLEPGHQNQKTNCVGCHQHAGKPWSEKDFLDRLDNDLGSLTEAASDPVNLSDRIWSLYRGPEPFAGIIDHDIEYFDVYDFEEP